MLTQRSRDAGAANVTHDGNEPKKLDDRNDAMARTHSRRSPSTKFHNHRRGGVTCPRVESAEKFKHWRILGMFLLSALVVSL